MRPKKELETDVLIMGAGLAGIMSAISAAEAGAEVCIASSTNICSGSSFYPGTWGLGLVGPEDEADEKDLLETILEVGQGMAYPVLAQTLVSEIRAGVEYLKAMGVELKEAEKKGEKEFIPCFDHKNRDWHGLVKESARKVFAKRLKELKVKELADTKILRLIKNEGRVAGAEAIRAGQEFFNISCKALVIASGGLCGLFKYRLNTSDMEGLGQYLALEAGASLVNLEFMQMMPGYIKPAPKTIYNEKVFYYSNFSDPDTGENVFGDWSKEEQRERLWVRSTHGPFSSRLSSYPVDVRLFSHFLKDERGIKLTYQEAIKKNQPEFIKTYFDWLKKEKRLSMETPVWLGIFAHASNGGIRINTKGETGIPGLFACGEVTGGMHGADRLGGLSTANSLVYGRIAGKSGADYCRQQKRVRLPDSGAAYQAFPQARETLEEIRRINSRCAMVIRSERELKKALSELAVIQKRMEREGRPCRDLKEISESVSLLAVLVLTKGMLEAMLLRKESRGSHYREDFPYLDEEFARPLEVEKKKEKIQIKKIQ